MVSVKKLLGIEATSQGIQGQVGPGPPVHAFTVAELSGDAINERGPWAVASVRKGATEDHYHRGSHKNADRRNILRGLQGRGDLGKQAAPEGSDRPPLLPQVAPTVPCHPTEAPTSPSTQRRSGHSSFTLKSSESSADSVGLGQRKAAWMDEGNSCLSGGLRAGNGWN